MRLYRPSWKSPDGQHHKSSRWWLDFADGDGRRWRLPGLTDRRATEGLAGNVGKLLAVRQSGDALPADLLKWLEAVPADFRQRLADAALIDRTRAGGLVPLVEVEGAGGHLGEFLADLAARGVSARQRRLVGQRCRDVLKRAGCWFLRDLSAAGVQAVIAALAAPTADRPDGLSKQSLQHYVRALKQFSRWMHRERRTAEDMLVGVKGYNAETDKRHERRGFTADEMSALVAATRQAPARWAMTPQARGAAYILAATSGLRANEIRTLTRTRFALDTDPPTVTVLAGYSKHRRQDVQPLPADVAGMLAAYLADADPDRPFRLPDKTGKMVHRDMADGRALWISQAKTEADRQTRADDTDFLLPRDSRGLVLDFHSFRHGYVTAICRAAVSPRVMMELARHSDPRLTMKRYSRVAVSESAKALDFLPKVTGEPAAEAQAALLARTGTDDAQDAPGAPGCPRKDDHGQGDCRADHAKRPRQATPAGPSGEQAGEADVSAHADTMRFAISFAKPCGLGRTWADFGGLKSDQADGEETRMNIAETQHSRGFSATRPTGFEPVTTGSTVRYSSQLSYGPVQHRARACNASGPAADPTAARTRNHKRCPSPLSTGL